MQRIVPPEQSAVMMRDGKVATVPTLSELGIYSTFLRKDKDVLISRCALEMKADIKGCTFKIFCFCIGPKKCSCVSRIRLNARYSILICFLYSTQCTPIGCFLFSCNFEAVYSDSNRTKWWHGSCGICSCRRRIRVAGIYAMIGSYIRRSNDLCCVVFYTLR